MRNAIRLGVIVALALGVSGARADEDPYSPSEPARQAVEATSTGPSSGDPVPGPAEVSAGAGSMEPQEAVDEEPGSAAHQQWVDSIWVSP
jgi:hypothetical protein